MTTLLCVAIVLWALNGYVHERYTELATEFLNRFFESKNGEITKRGKLDMYRILDTTTNVLFHLALVLILVNSIANVYHFVSAWYVGSTKISARTRHWKVGNRL